MRAGLAASTVTPGSTPPDSSLTTPAREACAQTTLGRTNAHAKTRIVFRSMAPPGMEEKLAQFACEIWDRLRPLRQHAQRCLRSRGCQRRSDGRAHFVYRIEVCRANFVVGEAVALHQDPRLR